MKIGVFVSAAAVRRGYENNVSGHIQIPLYTAELLQQAGHEVCLITNRYDDTRTMPNCAPHGVPIHQVEDARVRGSIDHPRGPVRSGVRVGLVHRQLQQIKQIVEDEQLDALHLFGFNRTAHLGGLLRVTGVRAPIVLTLFAARFPERFSMGTRVLWRKLDAVVTATDYLHRTCQAAGYDATVVRHGIVRDLTKEIGNEKVGPRHRVLFWRDPSHANGADICMHVYDALAPKYPDISFDLAIRPHWSEIDGLDELEARHPNVHIYRFPYQDGITLPKLVLESLCVLLPFREMTINPQLTIAESLASGAPVVASDMWSSPELITPGVNGYLAPVGDAEKTLEAVEKVIHNREQALEMGQRAIEHFRNDWNWDRYVDETISVYESAVRHRNASPKTANSLHIVHYLPRIQLEEGGVVRAVLDMCEGLASAGHQVTLLTHDASQAPAHWKIAGGATPTVMTIPKFKVRHHFRMSRRIRKVVEQADVLHLHTPWDIGNLYLARCARKTRTPYIVSAHGMLDNWSMAQRNSKKQAYLWIVGARMLERASFVHCTAAAELEQATKWFPQGKGKIQPLVFDLSEYKDLPGVEAAQEKWPILKNDRPTLLFLSRIHYKKGIEILVDAIAAMKEQGRDVNALIAGSGDEQYLQTIKEQVREHGLEDRIEFVGHVSGDEKLSLFEAADVFVLPTSQENFGFVFFEAMACGTPVVTTRDVDTWPELEESGGAIVAPRNVESITAAVETLLDDDSKRREMGQRGRDWALDRFSGSRVIEEYADLYRGAKENFPPVRKKVTVARLRQVIRKGGPDSSGDPYWVSRYFYRHFTIYFTWLFAKCRISANMVTLLSAVAIFAGAVSFGLASKWAWLVGALLVQIYFILDHVDGELSRYEEVELKKSSGMAGVFYDTVCHAGETAVFAAIALRLYVDLDQAWWVMLTLIIALFPGGIDPWLRYSETVLEHAERHRKDGKAQIPADFVHKSSLTFPIGVRKHDLRATLGILSQTIGFPGYFVTLLICTVLDMFPATEIVVFGQHIPYLYFWLVSQALDKSAAAVKSTMVYGHRLRGLR